MSFVVTFPAFNKTNAKGSGGRDQIVRGEKYSFLLVFSGHKTAGLSQADALNWQVGQDSCFSGP